MFVTTVGIAEIRRAILTEAERKAKAKLRSGDGAGRQAMMAALKAQSSAQSRVSGKQVLKSVRRASYSMAPIADDLISLEKKMKTLRNSLRSAAMDSCVATKNFSPKAHFS